MQLRGHHPEDGDGGQHHHQRLCCRQRPAGHQQRHRGESFDQQRAEDDSSTQDDSEAHAHQRQAGAHRQDRPAEGRLLQHSRRVGHQEAINATVGTKTNRIRLGASDKGATGAIRCLYGSTDNGKSAPVRIRLTQYNAAAAAKKQVEVDVQASQDAGAKVTKTTVAGYPATLQIIAGGVIEMQYDTWTLSLAVSDKMTSAEALTKGLPVLANQALLRIIKNA